MTAINARWLLDRDGELVATLRDGSRLRLGRDDLAEIFGYKARQGYLTGSLPWG